MLLSPLPPPLGELAPLLWGILDMPLSLQIYLDCYLLKCMQSSFSQLKFVYIIEIARNENLFFKDRLLAPPQKNLILWLYLLAHFLYQTCILSNLLH